MSSVGHFSVQFAGLEECPEPFRDRLRHFLSPSEAVFEIIFSPAFVAGRLFLPASVFCVTNRQNCFRSRISGFRVQEHRRFHILELEANGAHGAEEFQVLFPAERNEEVIKLLSQAFPTRAGWLTSVTEIRR
jgi:hypothetical protein